MILPLLFVLQTPVADRPIRIWTDAAATVSRGRGVRLYVQAQAAGNLVVLHARTDGRIEVLFPARPTDDPHLTAGTWEVRGKGDGPIWTVTEPDGTGMILAALTPDPVWFDEFSRDAAWSPDALRPSWNGADAAGGMQDIVQRMLGDGGFTYDVLTYTVAPEAIAQTPIPQNSDDTFPTIDNTEPDNAALTTCGVSSPVQCELLNEPLFLGRHHRFASPAPVAPGLPTPANPQGVALMIQPIRFAPPAPSTGPVVPRRRPIPEAAVRSRVAPASEVPALASRPVTGARPGGLAGATPAARSALVLRYVHAPVAARPADPPSATLATAAAAAAPPARGAAVGAVAAAMPVRSGGVMLMSRGLATRGTAPIMRAAPSNGPAPAAKAAPPSRGTTGGWLGVPMRSRR